MPPSLVDLMIDKGRCLPQKAQPSTSLINLHLPRLMSGLFSSFWETGAKICRARCADPTRLHRCNSNGSPPEGTPIPVVKRPRPDTYRLSRSTRTLTLRAPALCHQSPGILRGVARIVSLKSEPGSTIAQHRGCEP